MKKRILSMLLSLSMVFALSVPALATVDDSKFTDGSTTGQVDSQATTGALNLGATGTNTTLTGTIAVTQVNVTVPTTASFTLDPTIDPASGGTDDPDAQVVQPTLTITNNSLVPVYIKVSNVAVTAGTGGNKPSLVQAATNLQTVNHSMMFAFKQTNEVTDFTTQSDWLTEGSESDWQSRGEQSSAYLINANNGRIEPATSTTPTSITMEICARTHAGWSAEDSFTITPTLVVSATRFV